MEKMNYRLLNQGELIKEGDEVCCLERGNKWEWIGLPSSRDRTVQEPSFVYRRAISQFKDEEDPADKFLKCIDYSLLIRDNMKKAFNAGRDYEKNK
jgi:hypothetical protein